ncbi:hypothetical protein [Cesiribacter andamanensis]|uniref:Outer membrane protein beta-barrel domain-containing protein n=1 Tax=Cesiribacter andamanensis AMV16 TaxID=1279009 RepID=M7NNU4_9BACT|nr:hypothetical protein [Cesiribacter andamanensis]EMR03390.1 hypothetical protein ADICEAN_01494 [Cesiribacter andamanensis AMV16]
MRTIILLLAFLTAAPTAFGQELTPDKKKVWLNVGLGGYGTFTKAVDGGISLLADVNVLQESKQYKFALDIHQEFTLFGPNPAETYVGLSAQIGAAQHTKNMHVALLGGVGLVGGTIRGTNLQHTSGGFFSTEEYDSKTSLGVGLPVRAELSLIPAKGFGLGISLFSNINTVRSVYGLAAILSFGSVR